MYKFLGEGRTILKEMDKRKYQKGHYFIIDFCYKNLLYSRFFGQGDKGWTFSPSNAWGALYAPPPFCGFLLYTQKNLKATNT